MARNLASQPNVNQPDNAFPSGRVRNKNNSANPPVVGTPIIEEIYGDIIEFFQKLLRLANITPNSNPDNETNGHQLISALSDYVGDKDTIIANAAASDATAKVNALASTLGDAATKDIGTTLGTVCAGDDSRLNDARELRPVDNFPYGLLHTKIFQIGYWDMDNVSSVEVPHGLTGLYKICELTAVIYFDSDVSPEIAIGTSLVGQDGSGTAGGLIAFNDTNIILVRAASGRFDNSNYDMTNWNRGFIKITYWP